MFTIRLLGLRDAAVTLGEAWCHFRKKHADHRVVACRPQEPLIAGVHLVDDSLPPRDIALSLLWSEFGLQSIGFDGHEVQRMPLLVVKRALHDGVEHLVTSVECISDTPARPGSESVDSGLVGVFNGPHSTENSDVSVRDAKASPLVVLCTANLRFPRGILLAGTLIRLRTLDRPRGLFNQGRG